MWASILPCCLKTARYPTCTLNNGAICFRNVKYAIVIKYFATKGLYKRYIIF